MTNVSNEVLAGWGAVDVEENNGGAGQQQERPDFMKISMGDNKVRVLDAFPHVYKERYSKRANGGQGASIGYFGADDLLEKANQAFMAQKFKEADAKGLKDKARKDFLRDEGYSKTPYEKVKDKNIIHVLDRATGEVKLLDKGNGIFGALKKLAMNPEYGDLRNYDVTITMEDTKGQGNFQDIKYTVVAARSNVPLTDAEKALYEAKKIDLKKFKTPNYTPEQAKLIADGATFLEVLGNGGDTPSEVTEKSDPEQLPTQTESEPVPEEKKETPVDTIEKGEELSPEELADIDFS